MTQFSESVVEETLQDARELITLILSDAARLASRYGRPISAKDIRDAASLRGISSDESNTSFYDSGAALLDIRAPEPPSLEPFPFAIAGMQTVDAHNLTAHELEQRIRTLQPSAAQAFRRDSLQLRFSSTVTQNVTQAVERVASALLSDSVSARTQYLNTLAVSGDAAVLAPALITWGMTLARSIDEGGLHTASVLAMMLRAIASNNAVPLVSILDPFVACCLLVCFAQLPVEGGSTMAAGFRPWPLSRRQILNVTSEAITMVLNRRDGDSREILASRIGLEAAKRLKPDTVLGALAVLRALGPRMFNRFVTKHFDEVQKCAALGMDDIVVQLRLGGFDN